MKQIILSIILLNIYSVFSQQVFDFESFKMRVLTFHPVIKQAQNRVKNGNYEVLKAKGMLDPKFASEISSKQFKDKEYYNLSNTGLKIPTWFGVDFKTGYEINKGQFISEEHATPGSGLWYAGVDIPLGQGLLFDERRSTILQAKIFQKNSENEQKLIINDLLLDAYANYWFWYEAFQKLNVSKEGLDFAKIRFLGVKQNALLGEVPAIDTVEAKIQLDNRQADYIQNLYAYQNAQLALNLYLWSDDFIPLELDTNSIPVSQISAVFKKEKLLLRTNDSISSDIPLVLSSLYKLDQLKIEEKWKKEQLKPQIDLSYNPLSQPVGNNPFQNFSINNYKFGLSVYVPLFLRKERGSLNQTKIKIENANLDLKYKINEIAQKESILRNDLFNLYDQLEIQKSQVKQAKLLRDSEQTRFDIGESSLFLVNSREISYLTYKIKLAEVEAKVKITEAKWLWLFSELE